MNVWTLLELFNMLHSGMIPMTVISQIDALGRKCLLLPTKRDAFYFLFLMECPCADSQREIQGDVPAHFVLPGKEEDARHRG